MVHICHRFFDAGLNTAKKPLLIYQVIGWCTLAQWAAVSTHSSEIKLPEILIYIGLKRHQALVHIKKQKKIQILFTRISTLSYLKVWRSHFAILQLYILSCMQLFMDVDRPCISKLRVGACYLPAFLNFR